MSRARSILASLCLFAAGCGSVVSFPEPHDGGAKVTPVTDASPETSAAASDATTDAVPDAAPDTAPDTHIDTGEVYGPNDEWVADATLP